MILPRVHLSDRPANSRPVLPHDNKKVFGDKAHVFIGCHDFDMGEALPIGANFVLALYDQNTSLSQHAPRFPSRINVQFKHRLVILAVGQIARPVIPIMALKRSMNFVGGSARRVHIGRIEHNTVNGFIRIR